MSMVGPSKRSSRRVAVAANAADAPADRCAAPDGIDGKASAASGSDGDVGDVLGVARAARAVDEEGARGFFQ